MSDDHGLAALHSPGRRQHRYFLHDVILSVRGPAVCQENSDNMNRDSLYHDIVVSGTRSGLKFSDTRMSAVERFRIS